MVNLKSVIDIDTKRPPMVVINGCPRSGTSLLDTLLVKKFNAVLMPETHFIPLFQPYLFLWSNFGQFRTRRLLLQAIYDFTEIRTNGTGLSVDEMRPYCLLATEQVKDKIAGIAGSYPEIILALFDEYRQIHNGAIALEKTAYYRPVSWECLSKNIPGARFIHVVRDGRDVAMSWKRTWFGPKNLALVAWLWAWHVTEGVRWQEQNPERCLQVHYEDLTADPDGTLRRISEFIRQPLSDKDYDQSSLEWLAFIRKNEHMSNLSNAVKKQNIEKWRTGMSKDELALFEAIAGDVLRKTGYELAVPASQAMAPSIAWRRLAWARLASFASKVETKRRLTHILPLMIWITRRMGLSLPDMLRSMRLVRS